MNSSVSGAHATLCIGAGSAVCFRRTVSSFLGAVLVSVFAFLSCSLCFLFLSHQLRNYVVTLKIDIHIISEFQYQECTFEEIQALGFGI